MHTHLQLKRLEDKILSQTKFCHNFIIFYQKTMSHKTLCLIMYMHMTYMRKRSAALSNKLQSHQNKILSHAK